MASESDIWPRAILHADMDAFFAAVEQLDNPELRGKPVLVGGPSGRGVVSTASYEARPFRVGSAMPMAEAMRRCPNAIVVRPRFKRYEELSKLIMTAFRTFSDAVEPLSLDEAFVDITGSQRLLGSPREIGQNLKAAVKEVTGGLNVSVGISNTKFVAKVASDFDKPDGLTLIPTDSVEAFLDPLPVSRLWGVGKKTEPRLRKLGLHTIQDVRLADLSWLRAELGSLGRHIHYLSRNQDSRSVRARRHRKSIGHERTLAADIVGEEAIRPHLLKAADSVAATLRRKGFRTTGVRVKLKTRNFQLHTRQRVLARPTDHAETLYDAAISLLPSFDLVAPMRLVGLAAHNLIAEGQSNQGDLFAEAPASQGVLDKTLDELRTRFGSDAVTRGTELDRPLPPNEGASES